MIIKQQNNKNNEIEIMVSFNVESLFTNVPIEGTVQATPQKLERTHPLLIGQH